MLKVGAPVRNFVARDRNNDIVWLGTFVKVGAEKPEKPKDVLLVFYAAWCKPCHHEVPLLVQYQQSHRDQVQVILVALPSDDLEQDLVETFGRKPVFPIVIDKNRTIVNKFFGAGSSLVLPFSYYISKTGVIANRMWGFKPNKSIERQLFESRPRK